MKNKVMLIAYPDLYGEMIKGPETDVRYVFCRSYLGVHILPFFHLLETGGLPRLTTNR